MISALPEENINIDNVIINKPMHIKPNFLFPSSPLTTKNNPTNNIKKYQKPIISPLRLTKYNDVYVHQRF